MNFLERLNLHEKVNGENTDIVLNRLVRQGYFERNKLPSDQEVYYLSTGQRGVEELGTENIIRLVQEVYGDQVPEKLEERIARSAGVFEGPEENQELAKE